MTSLDPAVVAAEAIHSSPCSRCRLHRGASLVATWDSGRASVGEVRACVSEQFLALTEAITLDAIELLLRFAYKEKVASQV